MKRSIIAAAIVLLAGCSEGPHEEFARACREMKAVGPPLYDPNGACTVGDYLSPEQKRRFAEAWFAVKDHMDKIGAKNLRLDKDGKFVPVK